MVRYKKLGYVALNVSDLARSRAFYEQVLGLQPAGTGAEGEAFFRVSADHHNLVLYQSDQVGLRRVGWEVDQPVDLARLQQALAPAGIQLDALSAAQCDRLHQGPTLRMLDPCLGMALEFYSDMQQYGTPYQPTVAQIQRLGHVVVRTREPEKAIRQYTETFNFRVSDGIAADEAGIGGVTFMRCFPNPLHHSFGVGQSREPGLHHVNFMVTEIDDIGRAMSRLRQHDVPVVYGPGRHPTSGSVFLYFLDPDGMTLEYSFGMEEFPEQGARKPRHFEALPSSSDAWGNVPDPRFGRRGAIVPCL